MRYSLFLVFLLITGKAHAETEGLLWRLESPQGVVSYVFGTMHSDDRRLTDFSPAVLNALAQSETFLMETLPREDASMLLISPDQANLETLLSASEFDKVRALADFHTMHIATVRRMKPWLLAVVFDLHRPQTPYAQDALLMATARDKAKVIDGLEENAAHFAVLDSLPMEVQLQMLRSVLARSQQAKERDFERLAQAYLKEHLEQVARLDEAMTRSIVPKGWWPKMRGQLLYERNAKMAEKLVQRAAQEKLFVAVGASHLPGQTGLLARMKAAGFSVKREGALLSNLPKIEHQR